MELSIGDCIPLICSFMERPALLRSVCSYWKYLLDDIVRKASDSFLSLHDIPKRSLDREYITLYIAMRNALQNDIDDTTIFLLKKICTYSGYLPIPWDLLAYDIGFLHDTDRMDEIYKIIYPRWTNIGKLIYIALTGKNQKEFEMMPISSLKCIYNVSIYKIKIKDPILHLQEYDDLLLCGGFPVPVHKIQVTIYFLFVLGILQYQR